MLSLAEHAPRRRLALTPLIDVVFLLLMFFMLTSSFDKFTTIDLTLGGKAVGTSTTPGKITNILVRVHEKGRLDVNGVPVETKNLGVTVQGIIIAQTLSREKVRILLQPRTKSQSQAIVDVVFALKKMKINNIVIVR